MIPADLRLRLVGAFVLVAAVSQIGDLRVAAAAVAVATAMAIAAPGAAARRWHRLLHVEGFVLLLFLTLPFTIPGEPLLVVGPLAMSVEGVARAALIACKVSACVLVLMTLLGGIEADRMGGALRGLKVPERIVRLFALTVRYLGLMREEARRLHEAMRARGFRPRSDRHTWRSYGYLIGMLLVRALERARRVEEAMLCRGYGGRFPYATLPAPAARDWAGLAGLCVLAAAAFIIGRG